MPLDHYRTLRAQSEFRQKIERSEFLGIAFRCLTDESFFAELNAIEKKHFDASHHCWAFRLFAGGDLRQRSSDAGEPSGTAGKPILSALEGTDLLDTAIVVVRWFGGVKLGTGGLSRAYRDTASETLKRAEVLERYVYDRFRVRVPFDMLGAAYRLADPPHVLLTGEEFGEVNDFLFDVRRSRVQDFARILAERRFFFTPPQR
jgi:uncharacterized YigZ family protein